MDRSRGRKQIDRRWVKYLAAGLLVFVSGYANADKKKKEGGKIVTEGWQCNFTTKHTTDCAGTVRNGGTKSVKDVNVCCEFTAPSGTKIDQSCETFFQIWAAGEAKYVRFDSLTHSQTATFVCSVKGRYGGKGYTEL